MGRLEQVLDTQRRFDGFSNTYQPIVIFQTSIKVCIEIIIFGVTLTEMGIKRFTIKEETEEEEPVNNIF